MEITAAMVKELREYRGRDDDRKKHWRKPKGILEKGIEYLREKAYPRGKKADGLRPKAEEAYIHGAGRIGVLVELIRNRFCGKTIYWILLDIAMQITPKLNTSVGKKSQLRQLRKGNLKSQS